MDGEMPAPAPELSNRFVQLQNSGSRLDVLRANTKTADVAFTRFALPRLPLSTLAWCGSAAGQFQLQRHRCLLILLLLDSMMRRWIPYLPTQVCGQRSSGWNSIYSDFVHLPAHILIAGSFQSLRSDDVFDAYRVVPSFDGVHAVEEVAGKGREPHRQSWIFVRSGGGEAQLLADPTAVFIDDVEAALRDATDRLHVLSSS